MAQFQGVPTNCGSCPRPWVSWPNYEIYELMPTCFVDEIAGSWKISGGSQGDCTLIYLDWFACLRDFSKHLFSIAARSACVSKGHVESTGKLTCCGCGGCSGCCYFSTHSWAFLVGTRLRKHVLPSSTIPHLRKFGPLVENQGWLHCRAASVSCRCLDWARAVGFFRTWTSYHKHLRTCMYIIWYMDNIG